MAKEIKTNDEMIIYGVGTGGATLYLHYDKVHQVVTDKDGGNKRVMTQQTLSDWLHMAELLGLQVKVITFRGEEK